MNLHNQNLSDNQELNLELNLSNKLLTEPDDKLNFMKQSDLHKFKDEDSKSSNEDIKMDLNYELELVKESN